MLAGCVRACVCVCMCVYACVCVCLRVTFLKGRVNLLQLWLPFPEAPEPLGNACPHEGEPSGCHRHVEPQAWPGPGSRCVRTALVTGNCTGSRAASAYSAAACGFTMACLSFARCRARLLPTAAGLGSPRDQPVGRWPQLLHSARVSRHLPMEDALAPKPCPQEALAPGALGRPLL